MWVFFLLCLVVGRVNRMKNFYIKVLQVLKILIKSLWKQKMKKIDSGNTKLFLSINSEDGF